MGKIKRQSIGREAAIELYKSVWWDGKTARQICEVQLFTEELCMDFGAFHKAMEDVLGRRVYIHEFGLDYEGLVAEFLGEREAPTLAQIIELIPAEKRILIKINAEN